MRSLALLASMVVAVVLAMNVLHAPSAHSLPADVTNPSGDWSTSGSGDPQDLFPNGTPGEGSVTISNDGPGDVDVTVEDADGNEVGESTTVEAGGTEPTFTVPAGGTVIVAGTTQKDAEGTYEGNFSLPPEER